MSFLAKIKSAFFKKRTSYLRECYSQEGEDILLDRYLGSQRIGYYVDVGAHHPHRFSNTFLLYKKGWRGINIEPTPGKKALFDSLRPKDINLECAIGLKEEIQPFYIFNETALNTFDICTKEKVEKITGYYLEKEHPIQTLPLKKVLDTHFKKHWTFDLLTIDVEGKDFEVLQSNDWNLYRPRYILVEGQNCDIRSVVSAPLTQYLEQKNYIARAKTLNTIFFSLESEL